VKKVAKGGEGGIGKLTDKYGNEEK